MEKSEQKTVTELVAGLAWGVHACHFYHSQSDLLDLLIPFFKAGLLNNQYCIWVTSKPGDIKSAVSRMTREVPKFEAYLERRQIEILPATGWYLKDGVFDGRRVLTGWIEKCHQALAAGYDGMRLSGNALWLKKLSWKDFMDYEEELDNTISKQRITAICTYALDKCRAFEVIDVVKNHGYALIKRGQWEQIENAQRRRAEEVAWQNATAKLENMVALRTAELAETNRKLVDEIGERTRMEAAVREEEMNYRSLFESSHDVIVLIARNGDIIDINRRGEELTEYSRTELRRMNVFRHLLAPEDQSTLRQVLKDLIEGRRREYEIRWRTKAGSIIYFDAGSVPRFSANGEFLSSLCLLRNITERKWADEQLRQSRERLRYLARHLQSVREDERTQIARELHDEIGQGLTAIKLALERSKDHVSPEIQSNVAQAIDLANELVNRVRDLSLDLRPAMLDDLGLLPALRWHCDRYTSQFKVKVDFRQSGLEGRRLPTAIEITAYRIVQEALTNVVRHADVDNVAVGVWANDKMLCIRIKESGKGFDPMSLSSAGGFGISGMRERANALNGQLKLESRLGAGTRLVAELPLAPNPFGGK